jgi:hypothetical protein
MRRPFPARIVGLSSRPVLNERLQVGIQFCGQHDLQGQVFIATLIASTGMPLPLSRSTLPVLDRFGIVTVTGPPGVGTAILAPSIASLREMGRSRRISLPSRLKKGCGRIVISIGASPASPPLVVASPLPLNRNV